MVNITISVPPTGNCDHRGIWSGVHCEDMGCRLLLSIQRMEREAKIRQKAFLCHRWEVGVSLCHLSLHALSEERSTQTHNCCFISSILQCLRVWARIWQSSLFYFPVIFSIFLLLKLCSRQGETRFVTTATAMEKICPQVKCSKRWSSLDMSKWSVWFDMLSLASTSSQPAWNHMIVFDFPFRHHGADCLSVCTGSWISGQCFCHLGHQESEILADPAHAAYGPPWRHLEAARICSLCP